MSLRAALQAALSAGQLRQRPPALPLFNPAVFEHTADGRTEDRGQQAWLSERRKAFQKARQAEAEADGVLHEIVAQLRNESIGRLADRLLRAFDGLESEDAAADHVRARALLTGRAEADDPALVVVSMPQELDISDGALATAARLALHWGNRRSACHGTDVIVIRTGADGRAAAAAMSGRQADPTGATGNDIDCVVSPGTAAERATLDAAIDGWISCRTLGNRPLAGAAATLVVPMQLDVEERGYAADCNAFRTIRTECLTSARDGRRGLRLLRDPPAPATRERIGDYFLPHVRNLIDPLECRIKCALHDQSHRSRKCKEKRADPLDNLIVPVAVEVPEAAAVSVVAAGRAAPLDARITSVRLHFAPENTIVATWTLEPPRPPASEKRNDKPWWQQLLDRDDTGYPVAAWTDLVEKARMISSSFVAEPDEAGKPFIVTLRWDKDVPTSYHLAEHTREDRRVPIQGCLDYLLRQALGPAIRTAELGDKLADLATLFELRSDTRARVINGLAVTGPQPKFDPAAKQIMPLLERLHTVEGFGTGFAYDEAFSTEAIDRARYRRYASSGSHYAASDHAFVFLGFGGFALNPILTNHFRRQYTAMAMHAWLSLAILQGFSRQVAALLERWPRFLGRQPGPHPAEHEYRDLVGRFLRFTNTVWCEQMSAQTQGIELYDLMLNATPARRELTRLNESLTGFEQWLSAQHQEQEDQRANKENDRWSLLAVVGMVLGAAAAVESGYTARVFAPVFTALDGLAGHISPPLRAWLGLTPSAFRIEDWLFEFAGILSFVGIACIACMATPSHRAKPNGWALAGTGFVLILLPIAAAIGVLKLAPARPAEQFAPYGAAALVGVLITIAVLAAAPPNHRRSAGWVASALAAALFAALFTLHAAGAIDVAAYLHRVASVHSSQ